jgi:hypothetical protein
VVIRLSHINAASCSNPTCSDPRRSLSNNKKFQLSYRIIPQGNVFDHNDTVA